MSGNLKSDGFTGKERYFRPSVAVDGVVLSLSGGNLESLDNSKRELKVLLIKRKAVKSNGEKRPFYGYWSLPGGFIRSMENCLLYTSPSPRD